MKIVMSYHRLYHLISTRGNGGEEPLDGSCGSPELAEDGEAAGLFRFMTNSGKAYCVSVEMLMEKGPKLSSTGEE